jgi:hypothetical protein
MIGATVALNVPIAAHGNRQQSVPDMEEDDHGDAAFADYVIIFNYFRRFGGGTTQPPVIGANT